MDLAESFLTSARQEAGRYRQLAEKALAQVKDEGFFASLDDDGNSLAVQVKHLGGNLRSRWTDFLTTDGEKPDRHRDAEFEIGAADTRVALMALWKVGWDALEHTLATLEPGDLTRSVVIRGEPHTVVLAIHRQLAHTAYHVGQIVQLARHFRAGAWQSLSIPRGASEEFNRRMRERFGPGGA
ncbi:MAG TPA: DUF1572 family protein [Thermoanaerobaculia bacterium]|nr:DUF1572 family protein [Thermoanaerobaculia bacterium]